MTDDAAMTAKKWYIQLRTTRKLQLPSQIWERNVKSAACSQFTRGMAPSKPNRAAPRAATSNCSPEMECMRIQLRAYHQAEMRMAAANIAAARPVWGAASPL